MGAVGAKRDIKRLSDLLSEEGERGGKAKPLNLDNIKDKTLEGIEGRIRNLKREQLFVFDKNDNLTNGFQGDATSVAFPHAIMDIEGATVTHGHPKGLAEFGGTFSFADVNNMLNSKWSEHRATASGQGEMNYIMRRTNNSNPKGLRTAINRAIPILERNIQRSYMRAYNRALDSGKSSKEARHVARQRAVGVLNAYYKRTFPKYGYEYITRKESYKYGR